MTAIVAKFSELLGHVRRERAHRRAPSRTTTAGPLDAVNERFHASYDTARNTAKHDGPVFVVLADELVVFHEGERKSFSFALRAFHVIKSVAHAPVGLYAMFECPDAPTDAQLAHARARIVAALESADDVCDLTVRTRSDLSFVLHACRALIDQTLDLGASRQRLDAFASALGPALLRIVQEATKLQLEALHEQTERAVSELSTAARAALHVVVAGDHQARARSLTLQYFRKRLGEPPDAETRVTYAEGVNDESAALKLVGTQRLDRTLARAFFGEEKRLQRDILGDAAEDQLRSFALAAIE